jgi:predicted nucleic acid-binding protein
MKKSKSFIDSNLWIYALLETDDQIKHNRILGLLENLIQGQICVSIQVINEVHWTLLRKYKLKESDIKEKVLNGIFPISEITEINKEIYLKSTDIRRAYSFSFWDSLIVSSALNNECVNLYSEDMQHGMKVSNSLNIINPFKNT